MDLLSQFSQHVSQLYLPGAVTLWCALFFGLASLWGYASALGGDRTSIPFARRGYRFFTLSIVLSAVVLGISLLQRDFRIEYVFQYSGLDLPVHYQFAAFWAGQKGSFLIWLFWGSILGLLLLKLAGRLEASVMGVYTLTLFGLLFILVRENPFVMLQETPVDGKGLNPLLQDDWMVIHPPIMFIGYALSAVPFAFAISALWRRDYKDWAARAFPWALGGFLVLGTAILMGGYWAYKTLGWGGYWGWDPVENASLVPWILGTALIHGLHLERAKGRYRRANLILSCLLFLSVLYGTFLTRSGVLADFSVHSFVDLGISGLLIFQMGFFVVVSLYLLATRLRTVPTVPNVDEPLSRGFFMVLATLTLFASACTVALGTSLPLLTTLPPYTWFRQNPLQVGPEWYNGITAPVALTIVLLLAVVPFLTWRGRPASEIFRKLRWALLFGVVAAIFATVVGVHRPLHLVFLFLAAAAIFANGQKSWSKLRRSGFRKPSWSLPGAGGYLAHVGVGIMLIGFLASTAYDHSTKVTLEQGIPKQVGEKTLTFERLIPRQGREKERMEVSVVEADGDRFLIYPKLFVNDRTRQLMANPDIRKSMTLDYYVSPIEYRPPGEPTGPVERVQVQRGQAVQAAGRTVRYQELDLSRSPNFFASEAVTEQSAEPPGPITLGAKIEIGAASPSSSGTSPEQAPYSLTPFYTFDPASGRAEAAALGLPDGGTVRLVGIEPASDSIWLEVSAAGKPARLAIDVTTKPLIKLVWWGLYVVLVGGILAMASRLRQMKVLAALDRRDLAS